uniref:Polyadenylation factor subunit 2 n=1 Tax=Ganoderma boninense TaxID=34458 RepID=A0A5K1K6Q5_9APHY|nr:Polyadenylation factor subunit 2 [Ganoderma boninense]
MIPGVSNVISDAASCLPRDSKGVLPTPILQGSFSSVGIAGFFGGDNAFTGVSAIALMPGRRWLGWYNSPGTFGIAKQFAQLAKLKISDSLFPNGERDPTRLFQLDGQTGPSFVAAHSGVVLEFTGHPGSILTSRAEAARLSHVFNREGTHGKRGTGQNVTILNLQRHSAPALDMPIAFTPPTLSTETLWSLAPMAVSVGASIMCALVADWFCFTSIVMGMVAHGSVCAIVGSGKLTFTAPQAALEGPPGDGVLVGKKETVILVGAGSAVNIFTRGRFFFKFGANQEASKPPAQQAEKDAHGISNTKEGGASNRAMDNGEAHHPSLPSKVSMPRSMPACTSPPVLLNPPALLTHLVSIIPKWREYTIWFFAILLMVQPVIQFFLVPLGSLFGQLLFVVSILASWAYNLYLSNRIDRDVILTQFLFDQLGLNDREHVQKYRLTTLTSLVAFTALVLASARPKIDDPLAFLDSMIPQNTVVWRAWKEAMTAVLKNREYIHEGPAEDRIFSEADLKRVDKEYRGLLKIFFDDAEDSWKAWCEVRDKDKMRNLRERKCEIAR